MTSVTGKEYQKLVNALQHHRDTGNILAVVIVDDWEQENTLISGLFADLQEEFEIKSWTIEGTYPSIIAYLLREPFETDRPAILFVEGWRNLSTEERDRAIDRLNQEREALRQVGCSFVFFVPPDVATIMRKKAGDFWDCITGPFEFVAATAAAERRKREMLRGYYLNYLRRGQGQLDFRGILPLKELISLPLPELFVPLQVRYEDTSVLPGPERFGAVDQGKTEPLDFNKLLLGKKRVVLLGDPGMGKTTLLSYIALALAEGPGAVGTRLGIEIAPDEMWFPLLFPVCAYARTLREKPDISLAAYLPLYFKGRGQGGLKPLFDYELERGNCLVLLDGLDEITLTGERREVVERIRDFILRYPTNRFIVTSRPASYGQAHLGEDFAVITITPFTKDEIKTFVQRWFTAFREHGFGREARSPDDLLKAILNNPGVFDLARTPLLLTIMVLLYYYRGARFPHRRVDLYSQCVEALVETWNWARSLADRPVMPEQLQFDTRYVTGVLGPIAFWMHEQEPGIVVARSELERRVALWLQEREGLSEIRAQRRANTFIEVVSEQSGLLLEWGSDEYGFPHKTFEEFLAAEYVAWRQNVNELVCERMGDPRWEEVIRLTAGLLRGERLEGLLTAMLATAEDSPERASRFVLIGGCLRDAGRGAVGIDIRDKVLAGLVTTTSDPGESFKIRRDSADVLGELGDPRLGEVVEIPLGELVMGLPDREIGAIIRQAGDRPDLRRMLALATPQQRVPVSAFAIDRYPVTNWQYKQFMDAGGYNNDAYWSEEGWRWRLGTSPRPAYWDDDEFGMRKPNCPVVGVSWYEAEAFCRWRSAYMTEKTGQEHLYRLPTEAEWEWAARGDDGRWWPWGMMWEEDRANTDSVLYVTTPVGIYPAGASPFEVLDMAGNVLEWTADPFKGYDEDYPQTPRVRTVRGGSFNVLRWRAMCTTRQALGCNQRLGAGGFRCVLVR